MKGFFAKKKHLFIKVYALFFFIMGKLPRKKKLIIFESYLGKQFSCNPRAIYEYLKLHPEKYDFEMIWSINKKYEDRFKEFGVKYSKRFSLDWLFKMATAQYWITNSRMPLWLPKPKGTIYIQTWHGTPLKKLANDMDEVHMPGTSTNRYKQNFLKEASKWDYLISPNRYSTEIFKQAFNFKKTIIESGYPRNDCLINLDNEEFKMKIKQTLKIKNDKKVVLYAPTWRDNDFYSKGNYKFSLKFDLSRLQKRFGKNTVILFRMHYLINENFNFDKYDGFAVDVTNYPDIRELYIISDILITDYSSVFFDFANLNKPMIFYTYDLEKYKNDLRGFYFDFEKKAPGRIVTNENDLFKELDKQIKQPQTNENFKIFKNNFCDIEDGNSSKRFVESILDKKIET
ncbi:CDP-glycerol glycerophosphotransferase family protein [Bacillus cabrialesii]